MSKKKKFFEEGLELPMDWSCPLCTFINPPSRYGCNMCGGTRPSIFQDQATLQAQAADNRRAKLPQPRNISPKNPGSQIDKLPFGGDMQKAIHAQDRKAVKILMNFRKQRDFGAAAELSHLMVGASADADKDEYGVSIETPIINGSNGACEKVGGLQSRPPSSLKSSQTDKTLSNEQRHQEKQRRHIDTSLVELYQCPITKDIFLEPTTLVCGHTFEKNAVEHEILHGSGNCPVCKVSSFVSVQQAGGLKVNIVLRDTVLILFPDAIRKARRQELEQAVLTVEAHPEQVEILLEVVLRIEAESRLENIQRNDRRRVNSCDGSLINCGGSNEASEIWFEALDVLLSWAEPKTGLETGNGGDGGGQQHVECKQQEQRRLAVAKSVHAVRALWRGFEKGASSASHEAGASRSCGGGHLVDQCSSASLLSCRTLKALTSLASHVSPATSLCAANDEDVELTTRDMMLRSLVTAEIPQSLVSYIFSNHQSSLSPAADHVPCGGVDASLSTGARRVMVPMLTEVCVGPSLAAICAHALHLFAALLTPPPAQSSLPLLSHGPRNIIGYSSMLRVLVETPLVSSIDFLVTASLPYSTKASPTAHNTENTRYSSDNIPHSNQSLSDMDITNSTYSALLSANVILRALLEERYFLSSISATPISSSLSVNAGQYNHRLSWKWWEEGGFGKALVGVALTSLNSYTAHLVVAAPKTTATTAGQHDYHHSLSVATSLETLTLTLRLAGDTITDTAPSGVNVVSSNNKGGNCVGGRDDLQQGANGVECSIGFSPVVSNTFKECLCDRWGTLHAALTCLSRCCTSVDSRGDSTPQNEGPARCTLLVAATAVMLHAFKLQPEDSNGTPRVGNEDNGDGKDSARGRECHYEDDDCDVRDCPDYFKVAELRVMPQVSSGDFFDSTSSSSRIPFSPPYRGLYARRRIMPQETQLLFKKGSWTTYKYPRTCQDGCVVLYLTRNTGSPPIQVMWLGSEHKFWVEEKDLRHIPQDSLVDSSSGFLTRIGPPRLRAQKRTAPSSARASFNPTRFRVEMDSTANALKLKSVMPLLRTIAALLNDDINTLDDGNVTRRSDGSKSLNGAGNSGVSPQEFPPAPGSSPSSLFSNIMIPSSSPRESLTSFTMPSLDESFTYPGLVGIIEGPLVTNFSLFQCSGKNTEDDIRAADASSCSMGASAKLNSSSIGNGGGTVTNSGDVKVRTDAQKSPYGLRGMALSSFMKGAQFVVACFQYLDDRFVDAEQELKQALEGNAAVNGHIILDAAVGGLPTASTMTSSIVSPESFNGGADNKLLYDILRCVRRPASSHSAALLALIARRDYRARQLPVCPIDAPLFAALNTARSTTATANRSSSCEDALALAVGLDLWGFACPLPSLQAPHLSESFVPPPSGVTELVRVVCTVASWHQQIIVRRSERSKRQTDSTATILAALKFLRSLLEDIKYWFVSVSSSPPLNDIHDRHIFGPAVLASCIPIALEAMKTALIILKTTTATPAAFSIKECNFELAVSSDDTAHDDVSAQLGDNSDDDDDPIDIPDISSAGHDREKQEQNSDCAGEYLYFKSSVEVEQEAVLLLESVTSVSLLGASPITPTPSNNGGRMSLLLPCGRALMTTLCESTAPRLLVRVISHARSNGVDPGEGSTVVCGRSGSSSGEDAAGGIAEDKKIANVGKIAVAACDTLLSLVMHFPDESAATRTKKNSFSRLLADLALQRKSNGTDIHSLPVSHQQQQQHQVSSAPCAIRGLVNLAAKAIITKHVTTPTGGDSKNDNVNSNGYIKTTFSLDPNTALQLLCMLAGGGGSLSTAMPMSSPLLSIVADTTASSADISKLPLLLAILKGSSALDHQLWASYGDSDDDIQHQDSSGKGCRANCGREEEGVGETDNSDDNNMNEKFVAAVLNPRNLQFSCAVGNDREVAQDVLQKGGLDGGGSDSGGDGPVQAFWQSNGTPPCPWFQFNLYNAHAGLRKIWKLFEIYTHHWTSSNRFSPKEIRVSAQICKATTGPVSKYSPAKWMTLRELVKIPQNASGWYTVLDAAKTPTYLPWLQDYSNVEVVSLSELIMSIRVEILSNWDGGPDSRIAGIRFLVPQSKGERKSMLQALVPPSPPPPANLKVPTNAITTLASSVHIAPCGLSGFGGHPPQVFTTYGDKSKLKMVKIDGRNDSVLARPSESSHLQLRHWNDGDSTIFSRSGCAGDVPYSATSIELCGRDNGGNKGLSSSGINAPSSICPAAVEMFWAQADNAGREWMIPIPSRMSLVDDKDGGEILVATPSIAAAPLTAATAVDDGPSIALTEEGDRLSEWWVWVKLWRPTVSNAFRSYGYWFSDRAAAPYQVFDVAQKKTQCAQRPQDPRWGSVVENDANGVWVRSGRPFKHPMQQQEQDAGRGGSDGPSSSSSPSSFTTGFPRFRWGSEKDGNAFSFGASEFLFTTDPTFHPDRADALALFAAASPNGVVYSETGVLNPKASIAVCPSSPIPTNGSASARHHNLPNASANSINLTAAATAVTNKTATALAPTPAFLAPPPPSVAATVAIGVAVWPDGPAMLRFPKNHVLDVLFSSSVRIRRGKGDAGERSSRTKPSSAPSASALFSPTSANQIDLHKRLQAFLEKSKKRFPRVWDHDHGNDSSGDDDDDEDDGDGDGDDDGGDHICVACAGDPGGAGLPSSSSPPTTFSSPSSSLPPSSSGVFDARAVACLPFGLFYGQHVRSLRFKEWGTGVVVGVERVVLVGAPLQQDGVLWIAWEGDAGATCRSDNWRRALLKLVDDDEEGGDNAGEGDDDDDDDGVDRCGLGGSNGDGARLGSWNRLDTSAASLAASSPSSSSSSSSSTSAWRGVRRSSGVRALNEKRGDEERVKVAVAAAGGAHALALPFRSTEAKAALPPFFSHLKPQTSQSDMALSSSSASSPSPLKPACGRDDDDDAIPQPQLLLSALVSLTYLCSEPGAVATLLLPRTKISRRRKSDPSAAAAATTAVFTTKTDGPAVEEGGAEATLKKVTEGGPALCCSRADDDDGLFSWLTPVLTAALLLVGEIREEKGGYPHTRSPKGTSAASSSVAEAPASSSSSSSSSNLRSLSSASLPSPPRPHDAGGGGGGVASVVAAHVVALASTLLASCLELDANRHLQSLVRGGGGENDDDDDDDDDGGDGDGSSRDWCAGGGDVRRGSGLCGNYGEGGWVAPEADISTLACFLDHGHPGRNSSSSKSGGSSSSGGGRRRRSVYFLTTVSNYFTQRFPSLERLVTNLLVRSSSTAPASENVDEEGGSGGVDEEETPASMWPAQPPSCWSMLCALQFAEMMVHAKCCGDLSTHDDDDDDDDDNDVGVGGGGGDVCHPPLSSLEGSALTRALALLDPKQAASGPAFACGLRVVASLCRLAKKQQQQQATPPSSPSLSLCDVLCSPSPRDHSRRGCGGVPRALALAADALAPLRRNRASAGLVLLISAAARNLEAAFQCRHQPRSRGSSSSGSGGGGGGGTSSGTYVGECGGSGGGRGALSGKEAKPASLSHCLTRLFGCANKLATASTTTTAPTTASDRNCGVGDGSSLHESKVRRGGRDCANSVDKRESEKTGRFQKGAEMKSEVQAGSASVVFRFPSSGSVMVGAGGGLSTSVCFQKGDGVVQSFQRSDGSCHSSERSNPKQHRGIGDTAEGTRDAADAADDDGDDDYDYDDECGTNLLVEEAAVSDLGGSASTRTCSGDGGSDDGDVVSTGVDDGMLLVSSSWEFFVETTVTVGTAEGKPLSFTCFVNDRAVGTFELPSVGKDESGRHRKELVRVSETFPARVTTSATSAPQAPPPLSSFSPSSSASSLSLSMSLAPATKSGAGAGASASDNGEDAGAAASLRGVDDHAAVFSASSVEAQAVVLVGGRHGVRLKVSANEAVAAGGGNCSFVTSPQGSVALALTTPPASPLLEAQTQAQICPPQPTVGVFLGAAATQPLRSCVFLDTALDNHALLCSTPRQRGGEVFVLS